MAAAAWTTSPFNVAPQSDCSLGQGSAARLIASTFDGALVQINAGLAHNEADLAGVGDPARLAPDPEVKGDGSEV